MAALQQPRYVYMNGRLTPWEDARLHIGCEAATRGLNVFEGIKGYWQPDDTFAIVMLREHYERLQRSARLLYIPFEHSYDAFCDAIFELLSALLTPDRDMWVRTTLYVVEGHWGENTRADLVLTAYHQDKGMPDPVRLGVSTWRRAADVALPARIKTSTNYQVARLARIEARRQGCDDMVLLNDHGRVAETTAAALLIVRGGTVYTPPASEGSLESLTLDACLHLATSLDIPHERRPIERSELLIADELAMCGTLNEITLVEQIEGLTPSGNGGVLKRLRQRYFEAVRDGYHQALVPLTYVPGIGSTV